MKPSKRKVDQLRCKNIRTNPPQNAHGTKEAPVRAGEKQERPARSSKILAAFDRLTPGLEHEREPGDGFTIGDSANAGRKRGAKNYSNPELRLLVSCVEESVGVPGGFKGAAALYNRIAEEKGWATRGANPLSQRWSKVEDLGCTHIAKL